MLPEINIRRILFATDFLESSRLALDYAVALAKHFHAEIVMLHVTELSQAAMEAEALSTAPSLMRRTAQERLNVLATDAGRLGIQIETHVEDGVPFEVILSAVERFHTDLLVLGIHGVHRGLEHLLIGSNTEKILLSANCPVLTVGAHVLPGIDLKLHLEEIIYFSDFTPEATAAAPYAMYFGKEFNVPVEVFQLIPADAENDEHLKMQLANDYCEHMKRALGESDSKWCAPAFHLERGMEIDQVIERAQSHHAGLIVLGIRTESQLGRHLHTSFAYHLLAKATCPVLSVRHTASASSREVA